MATSKQKLLHKRSVVLNKAPEETALDYGEIAINYNADSPSLYIKASGSTGNKIINIRPACDSIMLSSSETEPKTLNGTNIESFYVVGKNKTTGKINGGFKVQSKDASIGFDITETGTTLNLNVGQVQASKVFFTSGLTISGATIYNSGDTLPDTLKSLYNEIIGDEKITAEALNAIKLDSITGVTIDGEEVYPLNNVVNLSSSDFTSGLQQTLQYYTENSDSKSARIQIPDGAITISSNSDEDVDYNGAINITGAKINLYGNHLRYNKKKLAIKEELKNEYNNIVIGRSISDFAMPYMQYYFRDGIVKFKIRKEGYTFNVNHSACTSTVQQKGIRGIYGVKLTNYDNGRYVFMLKKIEDNIVYLIAKNLPEGKIYDTSAPGVLIQDKNIICVRDANVFDDACMDAHGRAAYDILARITSNRYNGFIFTSEKSFFSKYNKARKYKRFTKIKISNNLRKKLIKVKSYAIAKKRWRSKPILYYAYNWA